MAKSNVERIFNTYIKCTEKQAPVRLLTVKFCTLTNEVQRVCGFPTISVHISTKVIKKNYDKRTAEENDYLLKNGWKVVHQPSEIYKNKDSKRGDFLFAKSLNGKSYVCSIEVSEYADAPILYVVSLFRVRKPSYLESYELVWSWKGGVPSS
jgi:hypothetical protein